MLTRSWRVLFRTGKDEGAWGNHCRVCRFREAIHIVSLQRRPRAAGGGWGVEAHCWLAMTLCWTRVGIKFRCRHELCQRTWRAF